MNLSPRNKTTILLLLILILTGCAPAPAAPTPTAVTSTTLPPAATAAPTGIPTPTLIPTPTPIYLTEHNTSQEHPTNLPNPWTDIAVGKYTVFPCQDISYYQDETFDEKSGLWLVGGFGVLHKDSDSNHHWYPFNEKYPRSFLKQVVVSPSGEVWVTGSDNLLYRFDGEHWIDEGVNLPLYSGEEGNKHCSSDTIACIDFGPEGETWVMNNCMEIHYQENGLWKQFPFYIHNLGVSCQGMRVQSAADIQVKVAPG